MSDDYTKVCWYCGKSTMKAKGDFYQCSACGATWNEVPEMHNPALGAIEVIQGAGGVIVGFGYRPRKQRALSKAAARVVEGKALATGPVMRRHARRGT